MNCHQQQLTIAIDADLRAEFESIFEGGFQPDFFAPPTLASALSYGATHGMAGVVQQLLARCPLASLDAHDALLCAARAGSLPCLQALLPFARGRAQAALVSAASRKHLRCLGLLWDACDRPARQEALALTACHGSAEGLDWLLKAAGPQASTDKALRLAAGSGNFPCVVRLLDAGACDPLALERACAEGRFDCARAIFRRLGGISKIHEALVSAASSGHQNCVELLAPHASARALEQAMMGSAQSGRPECLGFLLSHPFSPKALSFALGAAALRDSPECVELLIPLARPAIWHCLQAVGSRRGGAQSLSLLFPHALRSPLRRSWPAWIQKPLARWIWGETLSRAAANANRERVDFLARNLPEDALLRRGPAVAKRARAQGQLDLVQTIERHLLIRHERRELSNAAAAAPVKKTSRL